MRAGRAAAATRYLGRPRRFVPGVEENQERHQHRQPRGVHVEVEQVRQEAQHLRVGREATPQQCDGGQTLLVGGRVPARAAGVIVTGRRRQRWRACHAHDPQRVVDARFQHAPKRALGGHPPAQQARLRTHATAQPACAGVGARRPVPPRVDRLRVPRGPRALRVGGSAHGRLASGAAPSKTSGSAADMGPAPLPAPATRYVCNGSSSSSADAAHRPIREEPLMAQCLQVRARPARARALTPGACSLAGPASPPGAAARRRTWRTRVGCSMSPRRSTAAGPAPSRRCVQCGR